ERSRPLPPPAFSAWSVCCSRPLHPGRRCVENLYRDCGLALLILNGDDPCFHSMSAVVLETEATLEFEGQRPGDKRLLRTAVLARHDVAKADRSRPQQLQQVRRTDRLHVRKKAGQLRRAAQFRFRKRCKQRAVHAFRQKFEDTHRAEKKYARREPKEAPTG